MGELVSSPALASVSLQSNSSPMHARRASAHGCVGAEIGVLPCEVLVESFQARVVVKEQFDDRPQVRRDIVMRELLDRLPGGPESAYGGVVFELSCGTHTEKSLSRSCVH